MEIRKILLGRDDFKSRQQILEIARQSASNPSEDFDTAEALLIFQTSTQQTWLVVTNVALYCVLDDLNKSTTRVQWFLPGSEIKQAGERLANISAQDKNDRVGLLQIGRHKNWLYTKRLFADDSVVNRLSNIVLRKMAATSDHTVSDGHMAVG